MMMKKDKNGTISRVLGENTRQKSAIRRAVLSLDMLPLSFYENLTDRVDVVSINKEIVFFFRPLFKRGGGNVNAVNELREQYSLVFKDEPLRAIMDRYGMHNFRDYDDFAAKAESIPLLSLFARCSNLTRGMFDIAKANPWVGFFVNVDYEKYVSIVGETSFCTHDMWVMDEGFRLFKEVMMAGDPRKARKGVDGE